VVSITHISFQEALQNFTLSAGERRRMDQPLKIKDFEIAPVIMKAIEEPRCSE
jgi:hypothetical protein